DPLVINTLPVVAVTIRPGSATVSAGHSQSFIATVTGTTNTAVTWSLGSPFGTISPDGVYTAPAPVSATQRVAVIATSAADPAAVGSVVVTVQPNPTNRMR